MKKKAKRTQKRVTRKTSATPSGYFFFRRVIIIPVALLFLGFLAFTQTQSWQFFITGKEQFFPNNPSQKVGYFHGKAVAVPDLLARNPQDEDANKVLGDTSNKRIEVDLTNQHVYAFEGDNRVYDFVVSTGLWGKTPTGEFTIQRRVRAQSMIGGNKALGTYYNLPNVEFVQFFGNAQIPWSRGYSFHSTYWHNNFGHPMSHGCINMKRADAETLWNWADQGTRVTIYGKTPAS